MIANNIASKNKFFWILVGLFYLVELLVIYLKSGIVYTNEASKYLYLADHLAWDNWVELVEKYKFYITYALVLKVGLAVFKDKLILIFIHILLSFMSSVMIFRMSEKLFNIRWAARIAVVLFLGCYPIQFWTLTLYSETVFIFLYMLLFYYLILYRFKSLYFAIILSVLVLFTRPYGVFFVLCFWMYYVQLTWKLSLRNYIGMFVFCFIVLFTAIVNYKVSSTFYLTGVLYREAMCTNLQDIANPLNPFDNLSHTYQYLYYKMGAKALVLLEIKKLCWYFCMLRPHYSILSNLIFGFFNLYFFIGIYSFFRLRTIHQNLFVMLSFLFFANVFMVVLTYNEWHNRFNILMLPFLCIYIGALFVKNRVEVSAK